MNPNTASPPSSPIASSIRQVFVITHCRRMDLLYGSTLCFDSLRTGFPEAEITVIDNGSIPAALAVVGQRTQSAGGHLHSLRKPVPHWQLVQKLVLDARQPTALLDPDMVFWGRVDDLDECPLTGRLIPEFLDPFTECLTRPRLHTSFLKLSDPLTLQRAIQNLANQWFDWQPFQPTMYPQPDGRWVRYDTGAALYAALPKILRPFKDKQLNDYDHIFCGSHFDWVVPKLGEWGARYGALHQAAAAGNLQALKGIWRIQNDFFAAHSSHTA